MLESHGASRILASFHDISPYWVFAGLYFPDTYLAENKETVQKLLKAFQTSFRFIAEHEMEAREFLPKYTRVEREICMKCALREFSITEPMERLYEQRDLLLQYGYLEKKVNIEHMLDYSYLP